MKPSGDESRGRWVQRSQNAGIMIAVIAYVVSAVWVFRNSAAVRVIDPDVKRLTVAHFQLEDGYREGMAEIIRRYERMKAEEGVKVRITQSTVPSRAYQQWFTTQMVAGDPADIIETYTTPRASEYAAPLDEYVGKPNPYNKGTPIEKLSWRESLMGFDRNMRAGSYVWVYTSAGLLRLFGNLDLIEKATGERHMPQSLTEWLSMCDQITRYAERENEALVPIAVSGFDKDTIRRLFYLYYQVLNQEIMLDLSDDGQSINADVFWLAFFEGRLEPYEPSVWAAAEIVVALGRHFPDGFISLDYETSAAQFVQGRVGFMLARTQSALGVMQNAGFEVGIAPVPDVDPATPWYGFYDGPLSEIGDGVTAAYMIPKQTRNLDLAVDFLLFMTSYENNQLLNTSCKWIPLVRQARYEGIPEAFRPRLSGNMWSFIPLESGSTCERKMMETIEDLILRPTVSGSDGSPRARDVTAEMGEAFRRYTREYHLRRIEERFMDAMRIRLFGSESTRSKALCLQFRTDATEKERLRAARIRNMIMEEKGNAFTWLWRKKLVDILQSGKAAEVLGDGG